jgi:hypothetical protein
MKHEEIWETSVHELVSAFQNALIALVPVADSIRMAWREPESYDDWDQIAECLFRAIVVRSLQFSLECPDDLAVPNYDLILPNYNGADVICVVDSNRFDEDEISHLAFLGFRTIRTPFDHVECLPLSEVGVPSQDRELLIPIHEVRFILCLKLGQETSRRIDALHVLL